jgi:DNA-binding HxlR family transcriptional regulator
MAANKSVSCPVEVTLRVIGGRWKVMVLHELLEGTRRFNVLHRALPRISHRTLIRALRELEADDVVARRLYAQVPPKVEYSLTPFGQSLRPVLQAMHDWGVRHAGRVSAR